MGQGHWPQRQAALEALAVLVNRGDRVAIEAVMQRITDSDETCRQVACEVLGKIALPGDSTVISGLIGRLHDDNWLVRDAAGMALSKLATHDQIDVLQKEVCCVAEDARCVVEEALSVAR